MASVQQPLSMEALPSPLSSRPERTRISFYAALAIAAGAAFFEESCMKFADSTKCDRKSGGAEWRDLRFQSLARPLLSGMYSANFQLSTLGHAASWFVGGL
jgi:hypothetical protein